MSRRLSRACVAAFAVASLLCPAARADVFGPISLVSQGAVGATPPQQAEYAHDTAISADGRYLAFDGSIGGVSGVWRRDLTTGALQQVAGGDAELPSLSADGRYVSFTTNEGQGLARITYGLTGQAPSSAPGTQEAVNVYVRDMAREPQAGEAFALASAANGPGEPARALAYQASEPTKYGATATGRTAISADGSEVAFVTTAASSLAGPTTPPLQVAVRYLRSGETKLVSRCFLACEAASEPAVGSSESGEAYGAAYPGQSSAFAPPPAYGEYGNSPPPGASISADGSTVAWIGENIGQQAPLLAHEHRRADYAEPLWRRIQPGSETPTERVTGGSDPSDPACVASGETALPPNPPPSDPCQGPFVVTEQPHVGGILASAGGPTGDFVPRLSGDGYTVAFVSQAPLVALGEDFGRDKTGQPSDLYLADMHPGLTRDQALRPLTELSGGEGANIAATAPIFDFELAAGGEQLAFVTRRTQFPLGSPAYVSPPAGEAGMNELFEVDLQDDTLTRVTHGYPAASEASEHLHEPKAAGQDPYIDEGDGALSPALSREGSLLAFSSTASNLVFGDANGPPLGLSGRLDGSDAFVVARTAFAPLPTSQYISPAPAVSIAPTWQLGVDALQRPDGSVVLYVNAPGAGALSASAQSAIPVRIGGRPARGARARARGRRAGRASRGGRAERLGLVRRTVAAGGEILTGGGEEPVVLVLRPKPPYAALAARPGGLPAVVTVSFSAPSQPVLRQVVSVSFLTRAGRARRASHRHRSGGRGRR
jgi:hypothetical protein